MATLAPSIAKRIASDRPIDQRSLALELVRGHVAALADMDLCHVMNQS